MPECPHCHHEIDHLDYSVGTTEWGTFNGEDWETGDSEWDGDPTFSCPECNNNLFDSIAAARDWIMQDTPRPDTRTPGTAEAPPARAGTEDAFAALEREMRQRRVNRDPVWSDIDNPQEEPSTATDEGDLPEGEGW